MYARKPWTVEDRGAWSEVVAYVDAVGRWEVVAVALPCADATAAMVAQFIVRSVNDWLELEALVVEAQAVLNGVLDDGLTFSNELDAEHLVSKLAKRVA